MRRHAFRFGMKCRIFWHTYKPQYFKEFFMGSCFNVYTDLWQTMTPVGHNEWGKKTTYVSFLYKFIKVIFSQQVYNRICWNALQLTILHLWIFIPCLIEEDNFGKSDFLCYPWNRTILPFGWSWHELHYIVAYYGGSNSLSVYISVLRKELIEIMLSIYGWKIMDEFTWFYENSTYIIS